MRAGGRGKEAHQFIRPTAPPFHFAQEPTSRRRRGGKGSIPPEIIPLLRERTLSEREFVWRAVPC